MNQNKVMPEFISPPVTPKQSFELHFYEPEHSMILPPSPPNLYYQPYYNRRKVTKPKRSPSINTKGTFCMPVPVKNTINTTLARNTSLPRIDIASMLNEEPPKTTTNNTASLEDLSAPKDEETIKKSQSDAAAIYDSLTAESDPEELFKDAKEWIPSYDVFNRRPLVRISWKGSPLKIKTMPYFEKLHPGEVTIAATLRLTPEQYLKCKWALVLGAKKAFETNQLFRKSEAQKVCCIDVNKTSVLWHAFGKLGWLGKRWPQ